MDPDAKQNTPTAKDFIGVEDVAKPSTQQHSDRNRDTIRVEDPSKFADREVKLPLDRRQKKWNQSKLHHKRDAYGNRSKNDSAG